MQDWKGQRVVIVGAARQGTALAKYLALHGAEVVLTDQRPAEELGEARQVVADLPPDVLPVSWVCGGHPLSLLDGTDLLCVSGGVPLNLPLVAAARERGIPLSNDSQIFLEVCPCRVVGITGSAGKTTTTTLVGQIAEQGWRQTGESSQSRAHVWVGGNIGSPLIAVVEAMQPGDLAVMELSSFQLEIMSRSPQVAAVLNVTPNHLDRHGTMAAYTEAKAHILDFQNLDDVAVLGRDDPGAWSLLGRARGRVLSFGLGELPDGQDGTFFRDGSLYLKENGAEAHLMARSTIQLRGEHNLLNVLAACAIAAAAGMPAQAMRAGVDGFRGVPHRLEFVRSWGGADWYNDSIATAPERAMAAIRSFDEPLVLLAGGRDKDLPWEDFAALVTQRVDHLVLFGEVAGKIAQTIQEAGDRSAGEPERQPLTVTRCAGLKEAVQAAAQIVQPGDVVLLSPGGTSFDEFRDFEERGICFARWVKDLS